MKNSFVDKVSNLDSVALKILEDTDFSSQAEFNPRRARKVALAMERFGLTKKVSGQKILELGPGHFGFALIARALGADVTCFEQDPAFCRLGNYLGFSMREGDFYSDLGGQSDLESYDGLWIKGTFNACRLGSGKKIADFAQRIDSCLKPEGWGLLVPVNKKGLETDAEEVRACIELQKHSMLSLGWEAMEISESARREMAFLYAGSPFIFVKNLIFDGQRD